MSFAVTGETQRRRMNSWRIRKKTRRPNNKSAGDVLNGTEFPFLTSARLRDRQQPHQGGSELPLVFSSLT